MGSEWGIWRGGRSPISLKGDCCRTQLAPPAQAERDGRNPGSYTRSFHCDGGEHRHGQRYQHMDAGQAHGHVCAPGLAGRDGRRDRGGRRRSLLGRDILIPLALAILLSFMLAPIVIRLRRWGLGRIRRSWPWSCCCSSRCSASARSSPARWSIWPRTCRATSGICAPRSAICPSPCRAAAWSSALRKCCAISARN